MSYRSCSVSVTIQLHTKKTLDMMTYLILLVLSAVVCNEARKFNNPILSDKHYQYPSAIKFNGTYYVVAQTYDISKGMVLPVHTSTDLIKWEPQGYLFDETNTPTWADKTTLGSPSIHQVGNNFVLYFDAYNTTGSYFHIGVAEAPHPLGPYSVIDRPIASQPRNQTLFPSLINDDENLYLVWSTWYTISARQLNSNGLSFSSNETTTLLTPTLPWEGSYLFFPWHLRKGKYHYLFYTGGDYCGKGSIGVARSTKALGPYEKLPNPILVSNSTYSCMLDTAIVKDLNDNKDVIFSNSKIGDSYAVVLATLGWDSDHWPYIGEL